MWDLVRATADRIVGYREQVGQVPVFPLVDLDEVREALGTTVPEEPAAPASAVDTLVRAVEPALVATSGPRYFGFVTGGSLEAASCADLLAVGWDQNAFNPVLSPAAAVVEEVAGDWLKDLLGIPATASVGFVTGGQAANTVGLAAARHHVLAAAGWDVERDGLVGAPPIRVLAGAERHATIDSALRLLGLGSAAVEEIPADRNGAIRPDHLGRTLDAGPERPTIVCLQAGNVNTGACDDLETGCELAHGQRAWVHVDGAFGLWAAASPSTRHLVAGLAAADSWACDGHKWLNVPYDCGYAFCAHPESHAAAMSVTASYLVSQPDGTVRTPSDFVPEASRRARGFATWAALRQLGRTGVAELVQRCCRLARRFAESLDGAAGLTVVNDVVLNQVLVCHRDDARTDQLIEAVQRDGTCWLGGTTWRGRRAMRISVSNHATTDDDVDRSVRAILVHASLP
jgi:glutamate/tyrosine decarboxylase-like PLP-dependent enzyme